MGYFKYSICIYIILLRKQIMNQIRSTYFKILEYSIIFL
ncbi:hypothetical protein LEP1GSC115_1994 [Leptospira interrogans serovar Australis str. 200703203]|uniref:Uncharacterized protein n=1 Tax=Leptospira interrogans serovar Australis str. 200703203 TaxID=1085541 RepID=N1ULQ0_LEPIR|nr:hypothetical protein LEP1GSC115_1994 [Leptospira interrogans serovar Australis str. 200703203]